MSFVSTGNKSAGNGGPVITTPPITGESGDMSTGSVATGVADAAEQMAEQAAAELFGALPEPSGLVKAAVTAAQAAAAAAGISGQTAAQKRSATTAREKSPSIPARWARPRATATAHSTCCARWRTQAGSALSATMTARRG